MRSPHFPVWGNFLTSERLRGIQSPLAKLFDPGGWDLHPCGMPCARSRTHGHTSAHAPVCGRRFAAVRSPVFPSFFGLFQRRFTIMAALTQALVIAGIDKQQPVSPMGFDVIHHRGPGADASPGTLPAERFPQKLRRAQVVSPGRQIVPAVVLRAVPALVLGLVCWAPTVPGQRWASRMLTRAQWLLRYGLSPPCGR